MIICALDFIQTIMTRKLEDLLMGPLGSSRATDPIIIAEIGSMRHSGDLFSFFDHSNRTPAQQRIAWGLTCLIHVILLLISVPKHPDLEVLQDPIVRLARIVPSGAPPSAAAPSRPSLEAPRAALPAPMPLPSPPVPQPMHTPQELAIEPVARSWQDGFEIGRIEGPRGNTKGQTAGQVSEGPGGPGTTPSTELIHDPGGVTAKPVLLIQTLPRYTDAAVKSKVQGTVLLQGVVRKDGSVDDLRVIRALGFGLEEKAIHEIMTNWKFRPALLNGEAVNVRVTIEVSFMLH